MHTPSPAGGEPMPGPDLTQHPDYEQALAKGMAKAGLPDFCRYTVDKLAKVGADPDRLQCCHSGCTPCLQEVKTCLKVVQKSLAPRRRPWWSWPFARR